MNNTENQIKDIWNEIFIKKSLNAILKKMEENQEISRKIIKEEITALWNISEIPIFKQILDKLTIIQNSLEQNKEKKIIKDETEEPELVPITVLGRTKEPILMDISKSKPKITIGVKRTINGLAELHKSGKF